MTLGVESESDVLLADVGFGDSFLRPIPYDVVVTDAAATAADWFRWIRTGDTEIVERRRSEVWSPLYRFRRQPRKWEEFAEMCRYQQTAPESHVTRQVLCSRSTPYGRVTLAGPRMIVTRSGYRSESLLAGPQAYREVVQEWFGLELPRAEATRLWHATQQPKS